MYPCIHSHLQKEDVVLRQSELVQCCAPLFQLSDLHLQLSQQTLCSVLSRSTAHLYHLVVTTRKLSSLYSTVQKY